MRHHLYEIILHENQLLTFINLLYINVARGFADITIEFDIKRASCIQGQLDYEHKHDVIYTKIYNSCCIHKHLF